jgi:hypothetical protein
MSIMPRFSLCSPHGAGRSGWHPLCKVTGEAPIAASDPLGRGILNVHLHLQEDGMAAETREWGQRRQQIDPAFTTRPRRLLMIGRIQPGREQQLLDAHGRLPSDVAARAGIDVIEAFVGSGHYALLLEIEGENAQEALAAYFNDSEVREFLAALRPLVSGLPGADWQYVATDLLSPAAVEGAILGETAGQSYSSADLPLAASIYRWRREG